MPSSLYLPGNELLQITRKFHPGESGDDFVVETQQDVTQLIKETTAIYNDIDERARWKDVNHVASLPMSVYFDLKRRGILDDDKALRKWLNDPDNRAFRTRPGKL